MYFSAEIEEKNYDTTDMGRMARPDQYRYVCDCCGKSFHMTITSRMWHYMRCGVRKSVILVLERIKKVARIRTFKKY